MSSVLKNIESFLIDTLETVVIALSIFVVIYLGAFQPHIVDGESMEGKSNVHNGQYILTDKLTYRFREPQRGEIVVVRDPVSQSRDFIKRLIALPGEEIMLQDGKVYIFNTDNPDGLELMESTYLNKGVLTTGRSFLEENKKIKIPGNKYFVMGDNRPESSDSRTWGFVDKIVGRSLFIYWPPNGMGLVEKVTYSNGNSI